MNERKMALDELIGKRGAGLNTFEINVEDLLSSIVLEKGGSQKDFEAIVEVVEALSERKKLDVTGLLMVAVDCVSGNFSTKDAITQLKINCGEFGK